MFLPSEPVGSGKRVRLARILTRGHGGLFLVPLDHSITSGPIATREGLEALVQTVSRHGADGVVLHGGRVRFVDPDLFRDLSLVVHLSASTDLAPDSDEKVLVGRVEQAVALGADMVSVHVNLGADTEAAQLADLGRVAEAAGRCGLPMMAMVYPRGPRVTDPHDPGLVAHAAAVAADLGADIVKAPYTGSTESMARVVESCPLPVVAAGGPPCSDEALFSTMADIMRSGAAGVAVGRNVFQATDISGVTREIARVVHDPVFSTGRGLAS